MPPFWPTFNTLQTSGHPFCTVTLVGEVGSIPGDLGAKLLVTQDGLIAGNIGGGKVEARAVAQAVAMLKAGGPIHKLEEWNLQTALGMTCGGVVKLFFEAFNLERWPIVVFGAGHVAQAVVRVLLPLDCRLSCHDTRPEWLDRLPDDPRLHRHHSPSLEAEVAHLPSNAFVLLMTMGHATDLPILRQLLARDFPYIGVIGSKMKANALRKTLLQEGCSVENCQRFYCPVGLPLGANHPHEIAISIAAQLLQKRDEMGVLG